MKYKVFVSGGAGLIGSHLVDALVNAGFDVSVLDNLSSGNIENIGENINSGHVHFVKGDVRDDRSSLKEVLDGCYAVFHLAAIISVPFSLEHPDITFNINVEGTKRLLEESLQVDVERFIYFSSCAVYSEPIYLPVDEKHPTKPMSPYAESKLRSEELLGVSMVKPIYMPAKRDEVKHSYADIKKATFLLDYRPKIQLKEGLLSLLQHIKSKYTGLGA